MTRCLGFGPYVFMIKSYLIHHSIGFSRETYVANPHSLCDSFVVNFVN